MSEYYYGAAHETPLPICEARALQHLEREHERAARPKLAIEEPSVSRHSACHARTRTRTTATAVAHKHARKGALKKTRRPLARVLGVVGAMREG